MVLATRYSPFVGRIEKEGTMRFIVKYGALLLPALAVATPAFALNPPTLSDNMQPGSVIIYPKFVNAPAVTTAGDAAVLPRTEIEIGAVCPPVATNTVCPEHQSVKVRFHWVCPGLENVNSNICVEEDFDVVLSVNGKLAFPADGTLINSNTQLAPAAPCARGYLIGWVINPANDAPIKFDGLIGNAVIRGPNLAGGPDAGTSTAVSAYQAITIQADPALATGAAIATPTDPITGEGVLVFDGGPGHYTMLTGKQFGDVKFDKSVAGGPAPTAALNTTYLVFLTLDVRSNQPNNPTIIPIQFYNESSALPSATNPNFERLISTSWEFVCWTQVSLATTTDPTFGGPLNPNLTQVFEGTRKGIAVAGPANKNPELIADTFGPATLIMLVETNEGTSANGFNERKYNFNASTNGAPVPTVFVPFPF
jgi:hypothetical protein